MPGLLSLTQALPSQSPARGLHGTGLPSGFLTGGPPGHRLTQLSASGSFAPTLTALWSGILSISIMLRSQSCQQFGDRMTSFICAMFCARRTSSTACPITRKKLRVSSPKTNMVMWPAARAGKEASTRSSRLSPAAAVLSQNPAWLSTSEPV